MNNVVYSCKNFLQYKVKITDAWNKHADNGKLVLKLIFYVVTVRKKNLIYFPEPVKIDGNVTIPFW
jgi:hypothetical protein